jgi:DNA-directed RNA polymerase specialized sigma24 family protein
MTTREICPPDHKHAESLTCYKAHRCGCADCLAGSVARARSRRRLQAFGRWVDPYVDAAPVREHVEMLQSHGLGYRHIAHLAGASVTTVSQLIYGRRSESGSTQKHAPIQKILAVTAEKLLAVRPSIDAYLPHTPVPALPTRRRVEALMCNGWSLSKIARRLGVTVTNFQRVMIIDQVYAETHRQVAALFDELWDKQPAHDTHRELIAFNRTRNYAKAHGYLPALAWDDIDTDVAPPVIDEETIAQAAVDEAIVELAMSGMKVKLNSAERRDVIRQLHARGLSDKAIARHADCVHETVGRIREELNLPANEVAA